MCLDPAKSHSFKKISKIMTANVLKQDRNTHKVTKNAYSNQAIHAKREQREKTLDSGFHII